eukprot:gene3333-6594_t
MDSSHFQPIQSHPIIEAEAEKHYDTAVSLIKFGGNTAAELEHAIQELYLAISLTPNNPKIFIMLGEAYIRILDYVSTISCLRYVIKLDPNHQRSRHLLFEMLVLSGLEIFRHGKYYSKACYRFTEALKLESSRPKIWTFKAICHIQLQEYKSALDATTRAINTSSHPTADLFVMRAKLLWAEGLTDQGNRDINAAKAIDSSHPEVIAFAARSFAESEQLYHASCKYFDNHDYKIAIEKLNQALIMTPEDIKLHVLLSKIQRVQGLLDDSYLTLQKVIHIYEQRSFGGQGAVTLPIPIEVTRQMNLIFNEMALKLSEEGEYEKAIVLFKRLIESEMNIHNNNEFEVDYRFHINLGDCYRALEQGDKALSTYHTALRINPSNWDVKIRLSMTHYILGLKYFNEYKYIQTQQEMTRAIEYNPKISEYYAVRGKAEYYQGNYSDSYNDFKRALDLNPQNAEIADRLQRRVLQEHPAYAIPTSTDRIEVLLNAKNMRSKKSIERFLQAQRGSYRSTSSPAASTSTSTSIYYNKDTLKPTYCKSLLPKINPNLDLAYKTSIVVEETRRNTSSILYDKERSMSKDALWTVMENAKNMAASSMKPKHFKKKFVFTDDTTTISTSTTTSTSKVIASSAAALKRESIMHAKEKQTSRMYLDDDGVYRFNIGKKSSVEKKDHALQTRSTTLMWTLGSFFLWECWVIINGCGIAFYGTVLLCLRIFLQEVEAWDGRGCDRGISSLDRNRSSYRRDIVIQQFQPFDVSVCFSGEVKIDGRYVRGSNCQQAEKPVLVGDRERAETYNNERSLRTVSWTLNVLDKIHGIRFGGRFVKNVQVCGEISCKLFVGSGVMLKVLTLAFTMFYRCIGCAGWPIGLVYGGWRISYLVVVVVGSE